MVFSTDVSELPRLVPFPYRVFYFGRTEGEQRGLVHFFFRDHVEICIRISASGEEIAEDVIDGKVFRARFPHVMVKYPGVCYSNTLARPRNAFHICYDYETFRRMAAAGVFPAEPMWEIDLNAEVNALLLRLAELQAHSLERTAADRIDLCAFQLIQELVFIKNVPNSRPDYSEDKIMAIASRLRLHFAQPPDLDALAAEYGMSRRTFFRHWERHFRESPIQYLLNMKLNYAAEQLQETSRTIGELAGTLGFADAAYFGKMFRRKFGVTPLQYRKHVIIPAFRRDDGMPPA